MKRILLSICTAAVLVALFAQLSQAATNDSAEMNYIKNDFYLNREVNAIDAVAIKALDGDPIYGQEAARILRALVRQYKADDSSTQKAFSHLFFPKKGEKPNFSVKKETAPIEELKETALKNIEDLADAAEIKNTQALHLLQFMADPDMMPKLDRYDKQKIGFNKRHKQRMEEEKIRRAEYEKEMQEIKAQLRAQGITPFDEEEDEEETSPQEQPAQEE